MYNPTNLQAHTDTDNIKNPQVEVIQHQKHLLDYKIM